MASGPKRGLRGPGLSIKTDVPSKEPLAALPSEAQSAALANPAGTPEPPAEIRPFLFLGGEQHAASLKILRECKITGKTSHCRLLHPRAIPAESNRKLRVGSVSVARAAVLNVAVECERKRTEDEFEYFSLPLRDNVEEDITRYFNKAFEVIGTASAGCDHGHYVLRSFRAIPAGPTPRVPQTLSRTRAAGYSCTARQASHGHRPLSWRT